MLLNVLPIYSIIIIECAEMRLHDYTYSVHSYIFYVAATEVSLRQELTRRCSLLILHAFRIAIMTSPRRLRHRGVIRKIIQNGAAYTRFAKMYETFYIFYASMWGVCLSTSVTLVYELSQAVIFRY